MIHVAFAVAFYRPIGDDEEMYDDEGSASVHEDTLTFRELVHYMREYSHVSCWPASGATYEWLSKDEHVHPYIGERSVESLHYTRENPPKNAKYWRWAMRAAGHVKA